MRVLVTGIGGFAGPPVAQALLAGGHAVEGVLRVPLERPRLAGLPLALHALDLLDREGLRARLAERRPDAVLHLAGVSFAPAAERDPEAAYRANLGGTLAVLDAVRFAAPRTRVLAVTSAEVYGAVAAAELPITEDTPLRPLTVYGASKAAADLAAAQWSRAYGLDVVRARPFNHTGPGQDAAFVCAALARQIARIEAGRQEPVVHAGNLDPVRDFGDVRDVAAGYVALLERGQIGRAAGRVGEVCAVADEAVDGIRAGHETGVQTCALPICRSTTRDPGRTPPSCARRSRDRSRASRRAAKSPSCTPATSIPCATSATCAMWRRATWRSSSAARLEERLGG